MKKLPNFKEIIQPNNGKIKSTITKLEIKSLLG